MRPCGCCSLQALSLSFSFCYLSLISKRPCGCCSLRALSLSLSPTFIFLFFQRDPAAVAPLCLYLCLSLSIIFICLLLYFRETLRTLLLSASVSLPPSIIVILFQRDSETTALSLLLFFSYLSLSFHYCSLISERLCDYCSLQPVSVSLL